MTKTTTKMDNLLIVSGVPVAYARAYQAKPMKPAAM
jgi:hypothetical protein